MLPSIPGKLLPEDDEYLHTLKQQVGALFGVGGSRFPGAQPVSFARHHLHELELENYFVSEKADGIRCLMYITPSLAENKIWTFLIDRKNSYYHQPNLWLPHHLDVRRPQYETLLDGELVMDTYPDGRKVTIFYLFDCIVYHGKNLADRDYEKRLGYTREWILAPYNKLCQKDPNYLSSQPFKIKEKPLQLAYHVRKVFEDMPRLRHQTDGVIFTSTKAPYLPGTCEKMIKWKPIHENTVDFRIIVDNDEAGQFKIGLDIFCSNNNFQRVGELTLDDEEREEWTRHPPRSGSIAECRYDPTASTKWRFMRWRTDKNEANYISTYKKIMESIADAVDKKDLLDHSMEIKRAWYTRQGKPLPTEAQDGSSIEANGLDRSNGNDVALIVKRNHSDVADTSDGSNEEGGRTSKRSRSA